MQNKCYVFIIREKSALENLFIVSIAELLGKHGLTAYFSSIILIGCQFK
jgi:hypothetical protein